MPPMRQDQFRLKAAVTGVNPPPIKSWQGWSGGDPEAEDTKTRPGAGEQQISLGGPPTRSDVTITRLDSTTIHPYKLQWENVDVGVVHADRRERQPVRRDGDAARAAEGREVHREGRGRAGQGNDLARHVVPVRSLDFRVREPSS